MERRASNRNPTPTSFVEPSTNSVLLQNAHPEEFSEDYSIVRRAGEGTRSSVFCCQNRRTRVKSICKVIALERPQDAGHCMNEVQMQVAAQHPNVAGIERVYASPTHFHVVMERGDMGSLIELVTKKFPTGVPEYWTAHFVRDIAAALHHCHINGIAHRDIKPDNVVLCSRANDGCEDPSCNIPRAKLVDFGFAAASATGCFADRVGTAQYVAPQVLCNSPHYTYSCDLWSLGCTIYVLLTGRMPFYGSTTNHMYQRILAGICPFPDSLFGSISKDAVDLIQSLLQVNPSLRLTAADVLAHPWIVRNISPVQQLPCRQSSSSFPIAALTPVGSYASIESAASER